MSVELLPGMPKGVLRSRDASIFPGRGFKWSSDFVLQIDNTFEQYGDPSGELPERICIEPGVVAYDEMPPDASK